jgi:hypothetical protein
MALFENSRGNPAVLFLLVGFTVALLAAPAVFLAWRAAFRVVGFLVLAAGCAPNTSGAAATAFMVVLAVSMVFMVVPF